METAASPMQVAMADALIQGYGKWTNGSPSKTAAQVYVRRNKRYFDALQASRPMRVGFSRTDYADKAIVERLKGGKA